MHCISGGGEGGLKAFVHLLPLKCDINVVDKILLFANVWMNESVRFVLYQMSLYYICDTLVSPEINV